MKDKKNKSLFAILAIAALVLVVGVTYAFITITLQGEKENTITGGSLTITLNDTDDSLGNGEGDIMIENAFPVTDTVGKSGTPYTFTLQNTSAKDASYTIYLDEEDIGTGTRMSDEQVKIYLTDGGDNVLKEITKVSALGDKVSRTIGTGEDAKTVQSSVLYSGILPASSGLKTFVLRMWIADDADATVMGKSYATKISVDAVQVPEYAVTVINPVAVDENTPQEVASKAVFKSGDATFQVKAGAGTPSISCTNGVNATVAVNGTDATKVDVTVPSVTAHTTCAITYDIW